MPDLITFEEALERATSGPKLLLGNGFSQACRSDLFAYNHLIGQANFSGLSFDVWKAFDALGTSDFEHVMRAIRHATAVLRAYGEEEGTVARLEGDAEALKSILVDAVAKSHPDHPFAISDDEYIACRRFIRRFSKIYTLNYDLLLYWAAMRNELDDKPISFDDGFRTPEDEDDSAYVTWEPASAKRQSVYYLHGGLHLFDGGAETRKYTWSRTGVRLIDQIREAMDAELFPVFVSEGDSRTKLGRIRHHAYLSKGERSFVEIGGSLFVFGFAMAEQDQHILDLIAKNKVAELFVGVFGDPDSSANKRMVEAAEATRLRRRNPERLAITYYDASSAAVWG